jgi:hypothetical protein
MKKRYFSLLAIALGIVGITASVTHAQLNETFNVPLTSTTITGGAVSIGGLPTGWTQNNVDGLTPYSDANISLTYMGTNAWITRRLSLDGITIDTVAMSISWYSPAGTSNDYLITPQFTVPSGNGNFLMWQGVTLDVAYPDGYEVRVSTTGTSPADFSTIVFSTTAESANSWTQHAVDMSAFAGYNIYVAFRNNSTDKYILLIDDVKMQSITNADAELVSLDVDRFCKTNSNVTIKGTIKNNGAPITSMSIVWNDGSGNQTATLTGLNIAPYATYQFTHAIPFNKSVVNEYTVNVAIAAVNGGVTESNLMNNYASTKISTVANLPHKNVVVESGNGTWIGWSPRGYVAIEDLYADPVRKLNFIGIDVHNGDPMTNATYDNANDISGYPGCNINRSIKDQVVTIPLYQQAVDTYKLEVSPAEVSGTTLINASSRVLTINAAANFRTTLTDEVRFAVVLVEDSVHGTASGYAQTNYYSSTQSNQPLTGAGHNWQTEPSPVPAAFMWYNHVGRELIGGYNGEIASIPATLNDGTYANHTFSYTVPTTYDLNHLKVVIMVVNPLTAEIYNAIEMPVSFASITATGPTNICPGTTVTLTAPASNIYQWQLNGVNISGANSSTYAASVAGQYTVLCNVNGNVVTLGPIGVTLLPTPNIGASAVPSNNICAGNSITLFGAGGLQYNWSNGVVNGVSFVPTGNGVLTYQLQAIDANGCTQTINYSVNVESVQITQQPSDALVVVTNPATFQVAVASLNATYQWQVNAGTGWTNLSNLGIYSGVNTSTLTISNTQLIQNNTAYQCIVTAGNCSTPTNMAMLYVSTAVGLKEVSSNDLIIVPNPVKNACVISAANGLMNSTIKLTDITGKVVFVDVIKQYNQYEMNTSLLSNGIYFVEISNGQQIITKKLIKE